MTGQAAASTHRAQQARLQHHGSGIHTDEQRVKGAHTVHALAALARCHNSMVFAACVKTQQSQAACSRPRTALDGHMLWLLVLAASAGSAVSCCGCSPWLKADGRSYTWTKPVGYSRCETWLMHLAGQRWQDSACTTLGIVWTVKGGRYPATYWQTDSSDRRKRQ